MSSSNSSFHSSPHQCHDVHTATKSSSKRKLLLIYIHGFLGDERSFNSFPMHIHNLLASRLAGTHTIHTKIYPRYKSKQRIEVARDDFSKWLVPHESPITDVILLGHSMGGLLAAEVVLLRPPGNQNGGSLRHRILGTINFDVPFCGLHPGIVASGLASLFRGDGNDKEEKHGKATATNSSTSLSSQPVRLIPTPTSTPSSSESTPPPLPPRRPSHQTSLSCSDTDSLSPFPPPPRRYDYPFCQTPNYNPPFKNDVRLHPPRHGIEGTLYFLRKHHDHITRSTLAFFGSYLEFGGCLADWKGLKNRWERLRTLESETCETRTRFVNYYTVCYGRRRGKYAASEIEEETMAEAAAEAESHANDDAMSSKLAWLSSDEASSTASISRPSSAKSGAVSELAKSSLFALSYPVSMPWASVDSSTPSTPGSYYTDDASRDDDSAMERSPTNTKPKQKAKKERKFCLLPHKLPDGTIDPTWVKVNMGDVDEVDAHCGIFIIRDGDEDDRRRYETLAADIVSRCEQWIAESTSVE